MSRQARPLSAPDDLRARAAERSRKAAQRAAQKATRRRAWPAWTRPALRVFAWTAPVIAIAGFGWWSVQSGHAERTVGQIGESVAERVAEVTAGAGFTVRDVLVEGRGETPRGDIMDALGVGSGSPLLAVDLDRARSELERLPWVATAVIERRLPDTLFVRLTERRPLALWQHDGKLALIDTDGTVLTDHDLGRYRNLPILVGSDAPKYAAALLQDLAPYGDLVKRMEAAVRVGQRRWDLRLDNGVSVRLPETGVDRALARLAEVLAKQPILDRDVVAIDLRLPDRLVIQTSTASAERRKLPQEKI
ncbi:cell division protein FtsQ/DivIB [Arenibaculum pallidiluteum]|uniref:cell division protein FtsQ/DivIB n=1 Tax=Arenibaculum pallidiluteum TaxID=2812559 RepID=UPI001A972539|nr:cell division protein FtsQ/DivIB [Arenibaculum pallidiluteum]